MSFQRPSLTDLVTRVEADFISRLSLVGAVLRRSIVRILSRVVAGAAHMLHGHLEFLGSQLFPDKSEGTFLVRQASLYGMAKTAPSFAIGLTVPVTGSDGTVIPVGTVLLRSDGAEYTTDADVTIASGTASPTITAVVAGADGNADAGTVLSFQSPIAGADSTVTLEGDGLEAGTDEETTEEIRVRLLDRIAEPAHGGSDADWKAWTKEVAGFTRAWVTRLGLGPGTVVVRAVRDDDVGSIIPDSGELALLQAHLDEAGPAHCTVTAVAPVLVNQAFTFSALTPNTVAVKTAVTAELTDLFVREGAPGATIPISHIRTAIGTAAGITDYVLTSPSADVTHTANQFPGVGTITFP